VTVLFRGALGLLRADRRRVELGPRLNISNATVSISLVCCAKSFKDTYLSNQLSTSDRAFIDSVDRQNFNINAGFAQRVALECRQSCDCTFPNTSC
jgi:hypothetical protein